MVQRLNRASAVGQFTLAFPFTLESTYRRKILVVAPPGCVSNALVAAVEREFRWISVSHVLEPGMVCTRFDSEVQLILVDISLLDTFRKNWSAVKCVHPSASAAVMVAAQNRSPASLMQVMDFEAARGILPMDVNLDIWLSIMRIILKGGEYFPPTLFPRPQQSSSADSNPPAEQYAHRLVRHEQWSETMNDLTVRELEVLAMVARGYQNKIIAADLGLSEHTVKIHLHNIIRKLGVHNRTEAAAVFFKHAKDRDDEDGEDTGSDQEAISSRRKAAGH